MRFFLIFFLFVNKPDKVRERCVMLVVWCMLSWCVSYMAPNTHFYSFYLLLQIKKRFKEKVINPNKKSVNSSNKGGGGGGGGVNINNTSTTAAPRGSSGGGGGGGMYGMAGGGEESVDELSDDDEYGSQDPRKDMPD